MGLDLSKCNGDDGKERRTVAEWLSGKESGKWVLVIDNCRKVPPTREWLEILETGGKGGILVLGDEKEVEREMKCARYKFQERDARLLYPEGPRGR